MQFKKKYLKIPYLIQIICNSKNKKELKKSKNKKKKFKFQKKTKRKCIKT